MTELVLIGLIACAVIGFNVKATLVVAGDTFSERRQKHFQLALIWLLPILGAIITLAVHRRPEETSRRYHEPPDPGDDFSLSTRGQKNLSEAIDGD